MIQLFALLFSAFALGASAAEPAPATQTLSLGEQTSLSVEAGSRYSLGNPEVIQVKTTQIAGGKSLLLVKAKSQGYSDLIILGEGGVRRTMAFRVVSKKQAALARDGQTALTAPAGLQLRPNGEGWIAQGKVKSLEDWNSLRVIEEQGNGKVQALVKLHPLERAKAEGKIRRLLREAGFQELEVKSVGNAVLLQGDVDTPADKELAEALARDVFRGVRSQIRVPIEKAHRLRFRARILELLKSAGRKLGFEWSGSVPSALQVSQRLAKAELALDATLHLLEKSGQARLLSQPQLLLNEQGVAELRVGGEIPIPTHGRHSSSVQWKPYGLGLRLELPGVSRARARARITVELSSLDPGNEVKGIPALRVSRMDTTADLELGKPVLLSGLMESRESRGLSGLPFLGDIPVLGELFRSRDFRENRSELVILIEASR